MTELNWVTQSFEPMRIISAISWQVLLDFAKEVNSPKGPMEEQRLKYGPEVYAITSLGVELDVLAALWAENAQLATAEAPQVRAALLFCFTFLTLAGRPHSVVQAASSTATICKCYASIMQCSDQQLHPLRVTQLLSHHILLAQVWAALCAAIYFYCDQL
jgi:hypothetical protein